MTGEEDDDVQMTREGTSDKTAESAAQIVLKWIFMCLLKWSERDAM